MSWLMFGEHGNSGRLLVLKHGPRRPREAKFNWGGSRRRKPTGLAPFATDKMMLGIKSRRETGSTTWFRDCNGFDGVKSLANPYGATEHGWCQVAGEPLRGKAICRPAAESKSRAVVQQ